MSQGGSVNNGFKDNIAKQEQELSQRFGLLTTMFDDLEEDQIMWKNPFNKKLKTSWYFSHG